MVAFTMIDTSATDKEKVFERLSKKEGALEANLVYDACDKAYFRELNEKNGVVWKIRLREVQLTPTLAISKSHRAR